MENKLNHPALEQYALKYSDLLAEQLFFDKKSISGKEILNNMPVKQVGLFVLYNLFKRWKVEMGQLKSPYFNYEHKDVKIKLQELMNVLSKNILVSKEDFVPLLNKAIEDTLLLTLSPLRFFEELVDSFRGEAPNSTEVKELQQFVKINSHMRDALLTAWASSNKESNVLDIAFEGLNASPADVNETLRPFNKLLPIELDNFLLEDFSESQHDELIDDDEDGNIEFETIHTQFSSQKKTILADTLGFESTHISLKSMLTINQKFMFVNDLFDGNSDDFNKVIDFLDSCDNKEVVQKFLNRNYINNGHWKLESPQVKEFMGVLDKRFG